MSRVNLTPIETAVSFKKSHGFSLVELAMVLFITSLMIGVFFSGGIGFLQSKTIESDRNKLRAIEAAIVSFVTVNGRLPCPADGSQLSSAANAGLEVRDANGDCTSQTTGVVPWRTLGVAEIDASDSSNRRLTYRAGFGLARDNGMDMTACDPAGTGPAIFPATISTICTAAMGCSATCNSLCSISNLASCTPPATFLGQYKGLRVRSGLVADSNSQELMDNRTTPISQGAAFVLISHGRNGAGAYNTGSGNLTDPTSGGLAEQQNANGLGLGNADTSAWYAIDTDYAEGTGENRFDDLVIRPSIMKVVLQSQRGPRSR
jgi:type II secretory pathway pseudopilin PulG